jgi:hypothetical protein
MRVRRSVMRVKRVVMKVMCVCGEYINRKEITEYPTTEQMIICSWHESA